MNNFKIMANPTELPGMTGKGVERIAIVEVDALVEKYVVARDKRIDALSKEVELKNKLIAALHQHAEKLTDKEGTIIYRHDDLLVTLKQGKDDLKVKTIGDDDGTD